jgi:hypothetical protein
MTKISIYNKDTDVRGNDKWIGSDAQNQNRTKNFTPDNVAAYFNENQVIDLGVELRYFYDTLDPLQQRVFGSITFETEIGPQVNFSAISTFILSKYTMGHTDVSQFLDFLIGSNVLLSRANNINMFGYYKIDNIEPYLPDPNFFVVTLTFETGNGYMKEDEDYFISLVQFEQTIPEVPTKTSDLINDGEDGVHPFITAEDVPTPTLQSVTDEGDTTTTTVRLDGGALSNSINEQAIFQPDLISTVNLNSGSGATLDSTGKVGISPDGLVSTLFASDNITQDITLQAPNKTAGSYTLATTDDILPVTGFVPYTGATEDVDLGEFEIKAGQVEFDQTPTGTAGVGVMRWNDSDGTVDLGLKGGNVTLQVGQEQVLRVVNKTATNIDLLEANYQAVRVTGAQGQRLKVDLAQATNDTLSAETIGLVTETINNNQEGFITTSGLVRGINTTGSLQGETWEDGDILYLSPTTAGNATKVKPVAPNHLIILGYVIRAHINQGSIFVKVDNGYELDELHNVKITSAANNNVLAYTSATDIWENKTVETALGYTPFQLPSLTSGSVLFSNGTTIAQDNANLFWDDTNNRLGIGTNVISSLSKVEIAGALGVTQQEVLFALNKRNDLDRAWKFLIGKNADTQWGSYSFRLFSGQSGDLVFGLGGGRLRIGAGFPDTADSTTNFTDRFIIQNNGNVGINTTTDAGYKLDVNGTARVSGNATFGTLGTGTGMFWDNTNNRLGIGTNGPTAKLQVNANGALSTDIAFKIRNSADTADLMTVNGVGQLGIDRNFGLKFLLSSTISAPSNGNILLKDAAGTSFNRLQFGGGTTAFPSLQRSGSALCVVDSTGTFLSNLLVGITTDAGFRLDVNGTARVQGDITGTSNITCGIGFAYNFGSTATQIKHYNGNSLGFLLGNAWYGRITTGGTVFGSDTINASAVLEAVSTTKGFLPPRMTTTQKNAIATPAAGLVVYDTDLNQLCTYDGTWGDSPFYQQSLRGVRYFTDFDSSSSYDNFVSLVSGVAAATGRLNNNVPNQTANQIGIAQYQTGTATTGYAMHITDSSANAQQFQFGGGNWMYESYIEVSTLSDATDRFRFVSGFGNVATSGVETNGAFFTYDEGGVSNGTIASPNWQCVTINNGVRTLTTTSVAVTTTWTKLRIIVNAAATSVTFFINGTLVATHTTNIPTFAAGRRFKVKQMIAKSLGTGNRFVYCDYIFYENNLTTLR